MLNYAEDVIEFHQAMGLPLLNMTEEQLNANLPVRKRLIDEEVLREFIPAWQAHCCTEGCEHVDSVMDAICDSIYVLTGFCVAVETCNGGQLYKDLYTPKYLDREWKNEATLLTEMGYMYELMTVPQDATHWSYHNVYSLSASRVAWRCISRFQSLGQSMTRWFDDIWQEVHKTNMAKATGPVVNGKKMKPEGWCPPDIKGILEGKV